MTYYGAKELAESFKTVRKNTLQIAEEIPEDKYSFEAAPGVRTVEKVLTHIALGCKFQHMFHAVERRSNFDGIDFGKLIGQWMADEAKPRTKAQVIDLLRKEGDTWASFVAGLSEDFLGEAVQMPQGAAPPTKSRLEMILSVKEHEMHHRAQLMLVERMIGIVPHLTRDMQARMAQQAQATKA